MFSRTHSSNKDEKKKKRECTCANIKLDSPRDGGEERPVTAIECSSHPGICVLDENGECSKQENALHCADLPLKDLGKTISDQRDQQDSSCKNCCDRKHSSGACNLKVHYYKIDLNNSQDTGLIADKQCQTCGPECSPTTCSSRSREYFISWDKIRTKLFILLILIFSLWLTIYSALSLTSSL